MNQTADLSLKTVVLDDDPTGTQTVQDVAVLSVWDVETLTEELRRPAPLFYILTNTRALPEADARSLLIDLCRNLREAQTRTGVDCRIVSRGDSTLRGHFPAEPEAIEAGLNVTFDAWLLIPFFEEGGRITRHDVHYVREGDTLVPVADTPFARDAAFGFGQSDLKAYVEEKTGGRIRATNVTSVSLAELRNGDVESLKNRLAMFANRQVVVVNAETGADLEPLVVAVNALPHKNFLFRTAASWVKALCPPTGPAPDFRPVGDTGGLLVVGSYVPKTTEQLTALLDGNDRLTPLELPVETLLTDGADTFLTNVAAQVNDHLRSGRHVVVYTSRQLIRDNDPNRSLAIGNRVSEALVTLVRQLNVTPRFVLAKGGITSSDVATKGLGIRRAMVRGPLLAGVPVWEAGPESRFPGLLYVVFPGNVGDKAALRQAFDKLTRTNQARTLRAGQLDLRLDHGALRYIRLNGQEIIRSMYFALRDENWGTVPYRIDNEQLSQTHDTFDLRFDAVHVLNDAPVFVWQVRITGLADNQITFAISGEAKQPFRRNRAGFCVLHPLAECAGQPVEITQPDGTRSTETFPAQIAPHRPFPYIRAMRWPVADDREVRLTFAGDDFETEDQRNWGDGSYKTFCTPLSRPYPVDLRPGDRVEQRIDLLLTGPPVVLTAPPADHVTLTLTDRRTPLPPIGTLQSYEKMPLTPDEIDTLRALRLDHMRIEIDLSSPDWRQQLERGAAQAGQLDTNLFIALTFGEDVSAQASAFAEAVAPWAAQVSDLLLLQQSTYATPTTLWSAVASILKAGLPHCRLGAGTQTNYTELGQNPFDPTGLDFVTYGFQPQEHAFDDLSLVENVESLTYSVRSARALYPEQRVYVSPISFKKRFNPYALHQTDHFIEQSLTAQTDARQDTDFGAGWTLGVVKTLAEADCLTLFRATGALGLVPSPVYDLLKTIQLFRGGMVRHVTSSNKLSVNALLLEKDNRQTWLLTNHTPDAQRVTSPLGEQVLEPHKVLVISH